MTIPPERLAFHLGDGGGGAHRVRWDGSLLRYERYREGFVKLRESAMTPAEADWARFYGALERLEPWRWAARYAAEAEGPGELWSLELVWADRAVRASGEGAYPPGFEGFKRALWALLGNPPAV